MKVIILLGQRVRSGTNFIGTTLNQHPDVVCIPPNSSFGEVNLFKDDFIKTHLYNQMISSFGIGIKDDDFPRFMKGYGELWLNLLREKHKLPEDKTIFIKSPFIGQVDLWRLAFPESQIALLCRDGRDNVISSIKASNTKHSRHTTLKSIKRPMNYYSGRYILNHTKDWKRTANIYLTTQENDKLKKFRYEDLNDTKLGITELLQFYNLKSDSDIVQKCLNAPVVGSSFPVAKKGGDKRHWQPEKDKKKFVFTGKWHKWNLFQKRLFKRIAGNELIQLGYANDNKW